MTVVVTVKIQLKGSDLVGLPLLSTTHKVLTGVLLQILRINNPLLQRGFQIKYSTNIRKGELNSS